LTKTGEMGYLTMLAYVMHHTRQTTQFSDQGL
jgi:hypothetical protein